MRQKELKDTSRSMTLPIIFLFFNFYILRSTRMFLSEGKVVSRETTSCLVGWLFLDRRNTRAKERFSKARSLLFELVDSGETSESYQATRRRHGQFYSRFCECCCFLWNEKVEVANEFSSIKRCKIFIISSFGRKVNWTFALQM